MKKIIYAISFLVIFYLLLFPNNFNYLIINKIQFSGKSFPINIMISGDGSTIIYTEKKEINGILKEAICLNGERITPYFDEIDYRFLDHWFFQKNIKKFSKNNFPYLTKINKKESLWIGKTKIKEPLEGKIKLVNISADGSKIAYLLENKNNSRSSLYINETCINNQIDEFMFRRSGTSYFSNDNKKFTYASWNHESGGFEIWVNDKKINIEFKFDKYETIVFFNSDLTKFVTISDDPIKKEIFINKKKLNEAKKNIAFKLASDDWTKIYYIADNFLFENNKKISEINKNKFVEIHDISEKENKILFSTYIENRDGTIDGVLKINNDILCKQGLSILKARFNPNFNKVAYISSVPVIDVIYENCIQKTEAFLFCDYATDHYAKTGEIIFVGFEYSGRISVNMNIDEIAKTKRVLIHAKLRK